MTVQWLLFRKAAVQCAMHVNLEKNKMCENLAHKNVNVSVLITDTDVDNREAGDKITNLTTSALPVKSQLVRHFCSFLSLKPKMKVVPASTVTPDIKPTTPELKNCRNRSL